MKSEIVPEEVRFHRGFRLVADRAALLLRCVKYLFLRKKYPLIRLGTKNGLLRTMVIARRIGLRKNVQFAKMRFTSLTQPHFPSRAYDNMLRLGGLNIGAAGTGLKQNIDMALLAITRKCELHCRHCYERFNVGGDDVVPTSRWKEVIKDLQGIGTNVIVLSGGEPLERYDGLVSLLKDADTQLSDFHIHTSGLGMTLGKAMELRRAGLIAAAVGLDDVDPERHDRLRGYHGAHSNAVNALRCLRDAGIFTYVNICATRELIRSGDLWRYFDFVKTLDVGFIQLLEPRPCGGYMSNWSNAMLTIDDRELLMEFFVKATGSSRYRDYPAISYVAFMESPGEMGCMMGGLSHFNIDSKGNVNPCVFLPVTFGNIMDEDFVSIFRRMRNAVPAPLHKECPSIHLQDTVRKVMKDTHRLPVPYEMIKKEWDGMATC